MSRSVQHLGEVGLAVLAGGEGSRMGQPKIGLLLDGKPILHALLDRIQWRGPTVLSVAADSGRFPGTERFSRTIWDRRAGQGPLRGLYDVLADSPAPYLVVIAVDMPFVRRKQLEWLATQLKARPEARGVMITRTTPAGATQIEPFPSAFHEDFASIAALRLRQKSRALHRLAEEPSVQTVAPPAYWLEETWTNLNTPADLAAIQERRPRPAR